MHVHFPELKLRNLFMVDGETVSWLQECVHIFVSFAEDSDDTVHGIDDQY